MGGVHMNESISMEKVSRNTKLKTLGSRISKDFKQGKQLYLIILPVLAYYIVFHYLPMYGIMIAFEDFTPRKGIIGSPFVGFKHIIDFVQGFYFWRTVKNTLTISSVSLIVGFPAPIIFALMLNEIRSKLFSKTVQTITYMPHFISIVVVCGIIRQFSADNGLFNDIRALLGMERINFLYVSQWFVPLNQISSMWQELGWSSIIYLAALAGIDQQLYEAAYMDGAGRLKQTLHVTLPGIMPTVVILLILKMGGLMNVGFEKIILLYNPVIYESSDVISTYVYRRGLQESSYSFAAAVGMFNSVINYIMLYIVNRISRKVSETSLW